MLVPSVKIISLTLNAREIVKLVYILLKQAGASLEVVVASLMKRILEACSWRLTVCGEGYAASNGERLLQALTLLLMTMGMAAIGLGQGLLPMSLFHMMKTIITNGGVRVHPAKVWAMML